MAQRNNRDRGLLGSAFKEATSRRWVKYLAFGLETQEQFEEELVYK